MSAPAPLPWRSIVRAALAGTALLTLLVLTDVARSSGNPLDLVQPGASGPSAGVVRADFPGTDLPAGVGLDGQQYYAIARDPMHLRSVATQLDRPRYRLQRPLFPLLAWALHPQGGGVGLVLAFVVVGVGALVLGGLATGALSCSLGGPAWPAAVFALLPGAWWSLRVTVADSLALALAVAALAVAARARSWTEASPGFAARLAVLATALGVGAVLAKESTLAVLAGWTAGRLVAVRLLEGAGSPATRVGTPAPRAGRSMARVSAAGRAEVALVAVPALVAAGWAVVLRLALPGGDERVDELDLPGVGVVRAATRLWVRHREWWGMAATLLGLVAGVAALAAVARAVAQRRAVVSSLGPPAGAVAAALVLLLAGNHNVVGMNFGGTRAAYPVSVLGVVALAVVTARRPAPFPPVTDGADTGDGRRPETVSRR